MAYTVKQLAAMSGVSVRTLHFYGSCHARWCTPGALTGQWSVSAALAVVRLQRYCDGVAGQQGSRQVVLPSSNAARSRGAPPDHRDWPWHIDRAIDSRSRYTESGPPRAVRALRCARGSGFAILPTASPSRRAQARDGAAAWQVRRESRRATTRPFGQRR
jgi:hypothetical protein